MQHLKALLHVPGQRPARTDVLAGARHRAVEGIDVHLIVVGNVPGYAGALEHVNVLAGIDDTRHVVQVLRFGVPVEIFFRVGDHHRGAGGGEVHPGAAEVQVPARVLSMQHESAGLLRALTDRRHAQTPVLAEHGAGRRAGLDAVRGGVGESHLLENPEGVVRDGRNAGSGQGPVLSSGMPRLNRLDRFGKRRGALGPSGPSAT